MARFNTCRFCDDWRNQNLVKYGTRHYAHYRCYLDAGKSLDDLRDWQLTEFPYFLLKERGLLKYVTARLERVGRSVECPHCHLGFAPSVIDEHIREKH